MIRIRRFSGGVGALLAVLLAASGCEMAEGAVVGRRAPAFEAATVEGERVSLADLRGEVVLLNVWATWCFPCIREMPSLEALHRDLAGEGLRVVGVSVDAAGGVEDIRAFVEEHGLSMTILHDPEQRVARAFATRGVPETFLIGRDGTLLKHWIGRIDGRSESVRGPVREALGGG
jgi:cytochrome c biogenesis protein CcmG, thiol:disulfide interchange protein DsbE